MSWIQTCNHVVVVGERLAGYGDADGGGAGGDEPGAGGSVGWESRGWRVVRICGGAGRGSHFWGCVGGMVGVCGCGRGLGRRGWVCWMELL